MKKWLKVLLALILVVVVVVLAGATLLTRAEGYKLVTCSERDPIVISPADHGLPYEDVTVTTADGLKLAGWYIPSRNGAVVMSQHGFKSDRQGHLTEAAFLHRHGYGVLVTTTRCHDQSEGELITWGRDEMVDLEAWYQYLLTRDDVDPDRIGMMGESYGGAMSIKYAAQNQEIRVVVSQSTFASLQESIEIGIDKFVKLPPPLDRLLSLLTPMIVFWAEQKAGIDVVEVEPVNWIEGVSPRPVLILHGGKDDYAGPDCGGKLHDAAGEPKEIWFEPNVGHANFDEIVPPEVYEERLVSFFDRYLLEAAAPAR
jgi:dipeptidyl aminopeptidase/acylaminoacyl peptidase